MWASEKLSSCLCTRWTLKLFNNGRPIKSVHSMLVDVLFLACRDVTGSVLLETT